MPIEPAEVPNEALIRWRVGAVLLEQTDKGQSASRDMMVETFAHSDMEETDWRLSMMPKAA